MTVTVNGRATEVPAGCTYEQLIGVLDLPRTGIAIAAGGAVVPRSRWDDEVTAGADIEILTAVQGG